MQHGETDEVSIAKKKDTKNCGNITGGQLLLLLLITSLMTTAAAAATGEGEVDVSIVHQELEGFGASNVWSGYGLVNLGNNDPNIYDVIFGDLGLDILRLRNTYGYSGYSADYINNCEHTVTNGRARTGRPLKIMISSWSPKASLKSNGSVSGGGDATLKKDAGGFMYDEYADWWADSLDQYASQDMVADYINMQNEPDFDASWDSCRFEPSETSSIAGYDEAFEAVYSELYSRMGPNMPKMLAPETTGLSRAGQYISALDDLSHVYGYAHHLYNCNDGGKAGCASNPDNYIPAMTSFGSAYNNKPILQTEYSDDTHVTSYEACMDLAVLMHNALTVEGASGYLYWQLTYGADEGLVSITNTSWTINPIYYAFKHYSAFTDPGWYRVDASLDGLGTSFLRMSAYISPDSNQLSVIIINTSSSHAVDLDLSFIGFDVESGDVYRTSVSENCVLVGAFDDSVPLNVPEYSITTVAMTGVLVPTDCQEVQELGYALPADLSGNCYVDYADLETIAYYWLYTNCDELNDCDGADFEPTDGAVDFFDFSTFASQWMQCNDPEDSNCTPNWP